LSWATSNPFSKKSCAAQEAIHDHFRFSHHCVVRFFALPASVSLSGVSSETNFLGNILAKKLLRKKEE
jgi:hypothetical protein